MFPHLSARLHVDESLHNDVGAKDKVGSLEGTDVGLTVGTPDGANVGSTLGITDDGSDIGSAQPVLINMHARVLHLHIWCICACHRPM